MKSSDLCVICINNFYQFKRTPSSSQKYTIWTTYFENTTGYVCDCIGFQRWKHCKHVTALIEKKCRWSSFSNLQQTQNGICPCCRSMTAIVLKEQFLHLEKR